MNKSWKSFEMNNEIMKYNEPIIPEVVYEIKNKTKFKRLPGIFQNSDYAKKHIGCLQGMNPLKQMIVRN